MSDVDLKGYFFIQQICFRKYYELYREITFFLHLFLFFCDTRVSFMYILSVVLMILLFSWRNYHYSFPLHLP